MQRLVKKTILLYFGLGWLHHHCFYVQCQISGRQLVFALKPLITQETENEASFTQSVKWCISTNSSLVRSDSLVSLANMATSGGHFFALKGKGMFYSESAGEVWNRHTKVPKIAPELLIPITGMNWSDKMAIFSFFCINQINFFKPVHICIHVIINNF